MADFRTHATTGLAVGYVAAIAAASIRCFVLPLTPLYMFAATFIGSFLPDLDSDHGTSFKIVFSVTAVFGGGISFLYFLQRQGWSPLSWAIIPLLVTLVVRYGLGKIFQEYTVHRGIFHSVPAIGIVALVTPLVLASFALAAQDLLLISGSVGLGYLSHLVLDELYAVNFEGLKFKAKKSLGTALSFSSSSKRVTIIAYSLVLLLLYVNRDLLDVLR
ncbi:MAG: metal-dependent hydrolase [bacterium]|nr:metal-dependent hydrolase [bacterium]